MVVIVTGAGSGIGAAIARRFWDEGAAVALSGRTREKLMTVVKSLDAERSSLHVADVSVTEDVQRMVANVIERFGRPDG